MACSKDWRRILPLARSEETYYELNAFRQNREHAHQGRRDRYNVGGKDLSSRHKRIGTDVQKLRAAAGCFIDWFRISEQYDWISQRVNKEALRRGFRRSLELKRHLELARKRVVKYLTQYKEAGLDLAYGPKARR